MVRDRATRLRRVRVSTTAGVPSGAARRPKRRARVRHPSRRARLGQPVHQRHERVSAASASPSTAVPRAGSSGRVDLVAEGVRVRRRGGRPRPTGGRPSASVQPAGTVAGQRGPCRARRSPRCCRRSHRAAGSGPSPGHPHAPGRMCTFTASQDARTASASALCAP